jgi:hypothetical protein
MADADDLWSAVKADYDVDGLVSLTNIRDRGATTIDDSVGTNASQAVINLWPMYAQVSYDPASALHVEVAEMGVIAMLWRRGGAASSIEQVKWEEVFGDRGMVAMIRQTSARGRIAPSSNSGTKTSSETVNGQKVYGWTDKASLPPSADYRPRSVNEDV